MKATVVKNSTGFIGLEVSDNRQDLIPEDRILLSWGVSPDSISSLSFDFDAEGLRSEFLILSILQENIRCESAKMRLYESYDKCGLKLSAKSRADYMESRKRRIQYSLEMDAVLEMVFNYVDAL